MATLALPGRRASATMGPSERGGRAELFVARDLVGRHGAANEHVRLAVRPELEWLALECTAVGDPASCCGLSGVDHSPGGRPTVVRQGAVPPPCQHSATGQEGKRAIE